MATLIPIYSIPGCCEPVSSFTHLGAAVVFLVLSVFLIRGDPKSKSHLASLLIFAFSCVFLLSISGVYHLMPRESMARAVFRRIDHAAIYILIAATFTAVHGVLFRGLSRWGMIVAVWSFAVTCIVLSLLFFNDIPEFLNLISYIAFGWCGTVSGLKICKRYGFSFSKPLLYGGVSYTVGAVLDFLKLPVLISGVVGPHELFHIAVVCGIGYHWLFISRARRLTEIVMHTAAPLPMPAPG